jgi:very-short-patch-repair endonuclease
VREGQKRDAARLLRRNATDAARPIWRLLRDRPLDGVKFRRQVPIGPFVADFASIEHRLVVELDGGQHAKSKSDAARDRFLS